MRILYIVLSLALLLSCQNNTSTPTSSGAANPAGTATSDPNAEEITYQVSIGQLNWVGKKKVGDQHIGTIAIKGGNLMTKGNDIIGGDFKIDMQSIETTDLEGEMKGKLEGHLKSADFFDVENHPEATFQVTSARQVTDQPSVTHEVSGDLTIKGITNSIMMPVNASFVGDKVLIATPSFTIDRTKWDIKYGSGLIGTVADKIIEDNIYLVASIDAAK